MESIGVKQLRDNLSSVLKRVECGEVIRILRHGTDIAEIKPVNNSKARDLLSRLKEKNALGGGTGKISNIKKVKNLIPDKAISNFISEDRR